MTDALDESRFATLVEWACSTLPEKIRSLPDFPGIQLVDEPPEELYAEISKRQNWPRGAELRGCFSGLKRTERQFNSMRGVPDLIFVFRGPILRTSKGNLAAEVKQVVWHEVAHWLGHDEREVKELGLSLSFGELAHAAIDGEVPVPAFEQELPVTVENQEEANQPLRCIKCYSADVTCCEIDKSFSSHGAWLTGPALIHMKTWKCSSCGYEWDDEDGR